MTITSKTRKMLQMRSGGRCAICKGELTSGDVVLGQECHIYARQPGGPRFDPSLTPAQRSSYDNLLLLCAACHKKVDDNPVEYTAERLREIKKGHEDYIRVGTEPRPPDDGTATTPPEPSGPDAIQKDVGVLWSRRLDIPARSVVYRFRGRLLAEVRTESAFGLRWYQLYRLHSGRYVVYTERVHRNDYAEGTLYGVNAAGEVDPPFSLQRLQREFPELATKAGLSEVVEFDAE